MVDSNIVGKMNFSSLSHPVCGTVLWCPREQMHFPSPRSLPEAPQLELDFPPSSHPDNNANSFRSVQFNLQENYWASRTSSRDRGFCLFCSLLRTNTDFSFMITWRYRCLYRDCILLKLKFAESVTFGMVFVNTIYI